MEYDQQMKEIEKQAEKETVKKNEEKEIDTDDIIVIENPEQQPKTVEKDEKKDMIFHFRIKQSGEKTRKNTSFEYSYSKVINIVAHVENHTAQDIHCTYSFTIDNVEQKGDFALGPREGIRQLVYYNSGAQQADHSYVIREDQLHETLSTQNVTIKEITLDDEQQVTNQDDGNMNELDGEEENDDEAMEVDEMEDEDEEEENEAEDEDEEMEDDDDDDYQNYIDHEEIID